MQMRNYLSILKSVWMTFRSKRSYSSILGTSNLQVQSRGEEKKYALPQPQQANFKIKQLMYCWYNALKSVMQN